ncbi:hypothetical protein [Neptuniibacter sp. QD37_11]|uniref:hypothetical protein n=1 Tax=Neptuniibacter sp. QD37_11 TaxID=3398209 RepID=UPI0039F55197
MSLYEITLPTETQNLSTKIVVEAGDSDMACLAASEEAKKDSILTCRASLKLLGGEDEQDMELGEFTLDGHVLPQTWQDVQAYLKRIRAEAEHEARTVQRENPHLRCHRSRGVVISTADDKGETIIAASDEWTFPTTKGSYLTDIAKIIEARPNTAEIWAEVGFDSAESVRDMNDMQYEPYTGESSILLWRKGEAHQLTP